MPAPLRGSGAVCYSPSALHAGTASAAPIGCRRPTAACARPTAAGRGERCVRLCVCVSETGGRERPSAPRSDWWGKNGLRPCLTNRRVVAMCQRAAIGRRWCHSWATGRAGVLIMGERRWEGEGAAGLPGARLRPRSVCAGDAFRGGRAAASECGGAVGRGPRPGAGRRNRAG